MIREKTYLGHQVGRYQRGGDGSRGKAKSGGAHWESDRGNEGAEEAGR